jgi:hypothetical protein
MTEKTADQNMRSAREIAEKYRECDAAGDVRGKLLMAWVLNGIPFLDGVLGIESDFPIASAHEAPVLPEPEFSCGDQTNGETAFTDNQMRDFWVDGWKTGYKHGAWANQPGEPTR